MYDEKKSEHPEKVSSPQETLHNPLENKEFFKGKSSMPLAGSFGGLIFSGVALGTTEFVIVLILAFFGNFLYYGQPLLELMFDFILKLKKLKYDQTIDKKEANQHELKLKQMELDHEYRMKKLDSNGITEMSLDNTNIPPANEAEIPKYLS